MPDFTMFQFEKQTLVTPADLDNETGELTPAVWESEMVFLDEPVCRSLSDVDNAIRTHAGKNDSKLYLITDSYLRGLQWAWLRKWQTWDVQRKEDEIWNTKFAGTVSHVSTKRVVTGEGAMANVAYIDEEVLHEARVVAPESVRPAIQPAVEWLANYGGYQSATNKASKLSGVEFDGVMCSATAEDQHGLSDIESTVNAGIDIKFQFENGNSLLLTRANWAEFRGVWFPFRQSFFL